MDIEEIIRLLDYVIRRLRSKEPNRIYPSRQEELYVLGADLIMFGQMVQSIAKKEVDKLVADVLKSEDEEDDDDD